MSIESVIAYALNHTSYSVRNQVSTLQSLYRREIITEERLRKAIKSLLQENDARYKRDMDILNKLLS